ncbi:hypothetical protein [Microcoleus sp. Pol17_C1]|uniref:hypothetical protein n=1 Tax=unclassified Microcoleus TaxID=2642155 RepID=UPI002FD5BF44
MSAPQQVEKTPLYSAYNARSLDVICEAGGAKRAVQLIYRQPRNQPNPDRPKSNSATPLISLPADRRIFDQKGRSHSGKLPKALKYLR